MPSKNVFQYRLPQIVVRFLIAYIYYIQDVKMLTFT